MRCSHWRECRAPSSPARAGNPLDRLRRRQAVGLAGVDPGVHLVVEAGHADHVELVEVGGVDREELDPLEQRACCSSSASVEHALVEVEPRQLAVHVELGGVEARESRRVRPVVSSPSSISVIIVHGDDLATPARRSCRRVARCASARCTEKGREQSRAAGAALKALGIEPERLPDEPQGRALRTRPAWHASRSAIGQPQHEPKLSGGPIDADESWPGSATTCSWSATIRTSRPPCTTLTGAQVRLKKGGLAGRRPRRAQGAPPPLGAGRDRRRLRRVLGKPAALHELEQHALAEPARARSAAAARVRSESASSTRMPAGSSRTRSASSSKRAATSCDRRARQHPDAALERLVGQLGADEPPE